MGRNGSFSILGQNDTVLIALFYYTNLLYLFHNASLEIQGHKDSRILQCY